MALFAAVFITPWHLSMLLESQTGMVCPGPTARIKHQGDDGHSTCAGGKVHSVKEQPGLHINSSHAPRLCTYFPFPSSLPAQAQ